MKTSLVIALGMICLSQTPLIAADGKIRAAVVIEACNAEVRDTGSARAAGRQMMEVGEVHEIAATSGRYEELKIDSTQVALVPTSSLMIRECTPAELSEAQAKFNVLSSDSQREARKQLSEARRSAKKQAGCATCPKVQAAARARAAAARKEYTAKNKELREKNEALISEAKQWAAAGATASN